MKSKTVIVFLFLNSIFSKCANTKTPSEIRLSKYGWCEYDWNKFNVNIYKSDQWRLTAFVFQKWCDLGCMFVAIMRSYPHISYLYHKIPVVRIKAYRLSKYITNVYFTDLISWQLCYVMMHCLSLMPKVLYECNVYSYFHVPKIWKWYN